MDIYEYILLSNLIYIYVYIYIYNGKEIEKKLLHSIVLLCPVSSC